MADNSKRRRIDLQAWALEAARTDTRADIRRQIMRRAITFDALSRRCQIEESLARELVGELQRSGYAIHISGETVWMEPGQIPPAAPNAGHRWVGSVYRFGVISDTHYGSKYAREDVAEDLYDWFQTEGIERVYHAGNYIEGEARFNRFDLIEQAHGMQSQLNYFAENYPKRKGITTYLVSGDDHEGWYCFAPGVEIFTSKGWVDLAHVKEGDAVAGKDDDGSFVWQPVLKSIRKPHNGQIVKFSDRSLDFSVTPDHRFEVFRKSSMHARPVKCVMTAGEIVNEYKSRCIGIPRTAESWHGINPGRIPIGKRISHKLKKNFKRQFCESLDALDAALLCAWFATEGYTHGNVISISQSAQVNPEKCDEISALLGRLGLKHKRGKESINSSCPDLADWLRESCGVYSENKKLPQWVKDLPEEELSRVFDVLIKGDGHERESGWRFYSKSERLLADVTEIAQKLGYAVTEITHHGLSWRTLSITDERTVAYLFRKPEVEDYDGEVFCVSVPTQRIFVRRNGKAFWSMNCQREGVNIGQMMEDTAQRMGRSDLKDLGYIEAFTVLEHSESGKRARLMTMHPGGGSAYATSYAPQKIIEAFQPGEKPAVAIFGHYHKMEYVQIRGVHAIQAGCTKDLDPFGRKKRLSYHVGGAIIELRQLPDGTIQDCICWFRQYHDRSYVNDQFSHSHQPTRKKSR